MATDELDAPLGQQDSSTGAGKKTFFRFSKVFPPVAAGLLALFLATFAGWALIVSDPLGGEPASTATAPPPKVEMPAVVSMPAVPKKTDGPDATTPDVPRNVVTIIDGSTGKRHEVPIAGPSGRNASQQPLLETSRHGAIPKIGPDGKRPADVYARAAKSPQERAEGPRIAIVVTGLGVSASTTQAALSKLPTAITLAFSPYGPEADRAVIRARDRGHEVLLQVPMEPFDYPDNDPGPQTLLASLAAEQNIDRLHWLMSRFQGYVGISNYMGARFTSSEPAMAPVVREANKRGLIYFDDGASNRSVAAQIASANNAAFAKADLVIDAVPNPANIDRALARLEAIARERSVAVGAASALPASIDRIAAWSKALESRGIVLVPITAAAAKPRSS